MIAAIVDLGLSVLGFVIGLFVILLGVSLAVRLVVWMFRNPIVLLLLGGAIFLFLKAILKF